MTRSRPLHSDAPMRALVDDAAREGISIEELARRLGIKGPSIHGYMDSGPRVQVSTLAAVARAIGGEIVIGWKKSES